MRRLRSDALHPMPPSLVAADARRGLQTTVSLSSLPQAFTARAGAVKPYLSKPDCVELAHLIAERVSESHVRNADRAGPAAVLMAAQFQQNLGLSSLDA